jgi:Raf kinase inhibitor-like YbhB/YbcL family protein
MDFELTSTAFDEGGEIPARHTCDGEDAPPPFSWSGTPEGTAELALILDDPDARGFVHWLVVGIPAEASELGESGLPEGAREGRNDFGRAGYRGPCPPSGSHRYAATLYALSEALDLPADTTPDAFRSAASSNILAEARLSGTYARQ